MIKQCQGLNLMAADGWRPRGGQFIDAYNHTAYDNIACTILRKIFDRGVYFVVVEL